MFSIEEVSFGSKKGDGAFGFQNPILLTTLPNAVDYIGAFGEVIDIYYCVDEFSKWPGVMKELVEEMERDAHSESRPDCCNLRGTPKVKK